MRNRILELTFLFETLVITASETIDVRPKTNLLLNMLSLVNHTDASGSNAVSLDGAGVLEQENELISAEAFWPPRNADARVVTAVIARARSHNDKAMRSPLFEHRGVCDPINVTAAPQPVCPRHQGKPPPGRRARRIKDVHSRVGRVKRPRKGLMCGTVRRFHGRVCRGGRAAPAEGGQEKETRNRGGP